MPRLVRGEPSFLMGFGHFHHRTSRRSRRLPRPSLGQVGPMMKMTRSEEHTSELQPPDHLVCRLLLAKKKNATETSPGAAPTVRPSTSRAPPRAPPAALDPGCTVPVPRLYPTSSRTPPPSPPISPHTP